MIFNQVETIMKIQQKYGDKISNSNSEPKIYSTIYAMHKYWAKKPHNIISEYIKKYSKKKDIILDPFSGSGIALIEGYNSKRKAVGIDINPTAFFLSKGILNPIDIKKFEEEFSKIETECMEKINSFYKVKRKNKTYVGTHFIWKNNKLDEVRYKDPKTIISKPTPLDIKLSKSFTYAKIKQFFPKDKLFDNPRINSYSESRVCDLFTPRNTKALAILLERISKIKDKNIREIFRLCFSSMLGQTSKMVFVINNSNTKNGKSKLKTRKLGSWIIGYWIPNEHFEVNVWNSFVTRYTKILEAKKIQQDEFGKPEFVNEFKKLKNGDIFLMNKSAIEGLKKIPKNSIDYIITDPPHGDRIPYLELSHMWNSWLKNKVNYKNEVIISGAKNRNKSIENYMELLEKSMTEMVRVLKPNHCLTFIFNTHSERTWQEIFDFTKNIGLKIHDISTLNYSRNSVVQEHKEGGLRFDFVLTFKKVKSN